MQKIFKVLFLLAFIICISGDILSQENVKYGIVMTRKGVLNIRNQPGENNSIIGKFEKGDSVIVQKVCSDWYEVKFSNTQIGYCKGIYIDVRSADEKNLQTADASRYNRYAPQFNRPYQYHYWYEDWLVLYGDENNQVLIKKKILIIQNYIDDMNHYNIYYNFYHSAQYDKSCFIFNNISYLDEGPVEVVFQEAHLYNQFNKNKTEKWLKLNNGNLFKLECFINEIKMEKTVQYERRIILSYGKKSQELINKDCRTCNFLCWAGDLDRDGMLDMIIYTASADQDAWSYSLFLSAASPDSLLINEVAKYSDYNIY